jgi:uncharacterized protein YbjT (DUF2867 family)
MRVVVNTPTGHVGSALVPALLDAGVEVRLIARSFHKPIIKQALSRGAAVYIGSLDEPQLLRRAFSGADVVFWLTPPCYEASDLVGRATELGTLAAATIRATGVERVVHCSSFGAHLAVPPGPILAARAVEIALDGTGATVTHLRPAYFMDNDLWAIHSIRSFGAIFLPMPGELRIPRIATRDVAQVACNAILEPSSGRRVIELEGPARVTFNEAAAAISRAIGRQVSHVQVKREQARGAMRELGMTADAAERVLDLYAALVAGTLGGTPPSKVHNTTTSLDTFAREVFAPAYAASR